MGSKFTWNNHATSAIVFICVTLSAWIFNKPTILNWYGLGAALEVLYMLPSDSWRAKNSAYEHDEVKYRYNRDSSSREKSDRRSDQ